MFELPIPKICFNLLFFYQFLLQILLTPQFIKLRDYDTEHDLARALKSCCVLIRTAASIKLYILTYLL